jgi:hypothetical protein
MARFCYRCGASLSPSYYSPYYFPPVGYAYVPPDVVQQVIWYLSQNWSKLSVQEQIAVVTLVLGALKGTVSAIQRLKQWKDDRERYDPRVYGSAEDKRS